MAEKMMPVFRGDYRAKEAVEAIQAAGCAFAVVGVPWNLMAPHERQARSNHGGQSLARLAERGGLSACEALAILEDRPWHRIPTGSAHAKLADIIIRRALDEASHGH